MKMASRFVLWTLIAACSLNVFGRDEIIDRRFVPAAQTASITGNWALWHNPAGLAFMGGSETALAYLYEWSEFGNRHHGGINGAINLWQSLTLAGGIKTQAAFSTQAKNELGTDLQGIFGAAFNISKYAGFGLSIMRSHSFLLQTSSPWLVSFGLQARPWSFLSVGGHYEEVSGGIFSAPNITAGISVRPYKEFLTIGLDSKWVALGTRYNDGFRIDPILSLKASYQGYGAALSAEIPGFKDGWTKPMFALSLDFNFAHFGIGITSHINTTTKNYGFGSTIRASTEEWQSVMRPTGMWVELTIDQDGALEHKPRTIAERLFAQEPSPLAVLALLKRLESDSSIGGVVLNFNGFGFGDARAQEWRDAILALRRANIEVVVYLDAPSERDYYIASAANKIFMNKQATLSLRRFQATLVYFAEALDKIGVKADAVVAGSYKTAPRQWTNSRPQKEEVEVVSNILNNFYETLLTDVAIARNINRDKLKTLFDQGELTADAARSAGLIDQAIVPGESIDILTDGGMKNLRFFASYENRKFKQEAWRQNKKIAVIPVTNTIVDGRVSPGILSGFYPVTAALDVIDEIEDAVADPDVLGIILRIDSPGGDALAGHKIQHALVKAQKTKPVVTSMSDVAASAGYLIAAGSHILAMPNTITGSIGVFSLMFSGEKLAEKIGIFAKELTPIENPGSTIFRGLNQNERREAQKIIDWYYQNFIQTVSDSLGLDKKEVLQQADGRVWLGKEALEKKLVNELGGFSKAIDAIRLLAEVPQDQELTIDVRAPGFNEQFSLTSGIASLFRNPANSKDILPLANIARPYVKALEAYRINGQPQARLPYDIDWGSRH